MPHLWHKFESEELLKNEKLITVIFINFIFLLIFNVFQWLYINEIFTLFVIVLKNA